MYNRGSVESIRYGQLLLMSWSPNETESGGMEEHTVDCRVSQNTTIQMCFENEKHRVVQPATADARVLRLAAVCGDLPLQQRVIFTVSTIISTVDSYQYCSKPVVEWNKLHLKHHLPVWGLWPESETKSSKSNQKQELSRNNPRIPSHLLSGAFGDLIRGKLMEWNSYAGQMDVLDTKWRENGCGFCVYMGKFLTCAFVVVLVGGKKTLS